MKKDKWLSLALLMTLSGSYLTPSLALAEAVSQPPASSQATEQPKPDKNKNGIPDEEEDDNKNGIPDFEEDYNHNGTPDFKEPKAEEAPAASSAPAQQEASQAPKAAAPAAPEAPAQPQTEATPSSSQDKAKKDKTTKKSTKSSSSAPADKTDKETTTELSDTKTDDVKSSETKSSDTKSTETKPSASSDTADSKDSTKDSSKDTKASSDESTDSQSATDQGAGTETKPAPQPSQEAKDAQAQLESIAQAPLARPGQSQVVTPSPWPQLQSQPDNGPTYDWFSDTDDTPAVAPTYTAYVEHWSGDSAYTHNLLSHRYGIKAEQLDGYLNSLNINYDRNRINGKRLLEWEKESGMDARAIIAIAMAESSLGTAGVATMPGANMFGYGAFDSNPNNASNYNDQVAVKRMTKDTIIGHKNWTFKVQDDKAKKAAAGTLSPDEGGVYYTDTSGTGKRRAKIMEDIDKWIDAHGGTPAIPDELKNSSGTIVGNVPAGYTVKTPINTSTYIAQSYPYGQCTWYVYNRAHEMGIEFDPYMGNGGDWQHKAGYKTHKEPKVGYAVSFSPGQAGSDPFYGHVAMVEDVKPDGSILISESNALGLGVVSYRTFSAAQVQTFTFVEGK